MLWEQEVQKICWNLKLMYNPYFIKIQIYSFFSLQTVAVNWLGVWIICFKLSWVIIVKMNETIQLFNGSKRLWLVYIFINKSMGFSLDIALS